MFMVTNPAFRISHWATAQPFQDKALLERFVEGFRKAGLPELNICVATIRLAARLFPWTPE